MDIVHLKYFIEVARHKSFSKAAAASHVSQSAVSKMVKDLEQELGVALFNRNSKHVSLTDAGVMFLSQADQVVTLFANLTIDFESKFKLPRGKVSIGLPPMTESVTFAQLLGEFRKKYPEIDLKLYEYGSKKIEPAIREGILDIGIICRLPDDLGLYDAFSFTHEPLKVVVHRDHALANLKEVSLSSLAEEPFVLSSEDFSLHDEIIKKCKLAGFQPKIVFETSQRELMIQTVAANLGIAFVPSNICERLSRDLVRSIPLVEPQIIHSMSVIWKKGRHLSYPAKLCLEFAREYLLGATEIRLTAETAVD